MMRMKTQMYPTTWIITPIALNINSNIAVVWGYRNTVKKHAYQA